MSVKNCDSENKEAYGLKRSVSIKNINNKNSLDVWLKQKERKEKYAIRSNKVDIFTRAGEIKEL